MRSISCVMPATAVVSSIGIVRAATSGTLSTQSAGVPLNPYTGSGLTGGAIITAWSAAPTIAGTPLYLARLELPAVAGASVTWTWDVDDPSDVLVCGTTDILLWNFGSGAGAALDVTVQWLGLAA